MISKKTLALEGVMKLRHYLDNRVGGMTKEEKESINVILDFISMPSDLEWIPISKAVPTQNGEYITTTMYGDVYCDMWNGCEFDRQETVVAWMNLPTPYKWEDAK